MKIASSLFSTEDKMSVEMAISEAEKMTAGEIVPVIATVSGRYDRAEDLFGLVFALVVLTATWMLFQSTTETGWAVTQSAGLGLPAVAGILIGRGLIDPAKQVTHYLPELVATAWQGATLQQVMDMTTGVRYVEDYEALDSDIAITDIASGWKHPKPGFHTPWCIWDQILTLTEQLYEHGEKFHYRSIESDVLAHCLERVTGTRLAELVSRRSRRLGHSHEHDEQQGTEIGPRRFHRCSSTG